MRYHIIDFLRRTQILTHFKHLCGNQYSAKDLQQQQLEKLGLFLLHLKKVNPFYAELLQGVDDVLCKNSPAKILSLLPITDKVHIGLNMDKIFVPVRGRKYQQKQTGGSTGEPFLYYIDHEAISESWAYILWNWHRYADYTPGMPYITVAGKSLAATGKKIKIQVYQYFQNNYLISGDIISEDMHLSRNKICNAKLLYGYPSSILALLEMHLADFAGHSLKAVFTTSEQLTPNVRYYIESCLQVPVFDIYGANDGGIISCECECHNGYHYDPLNCFVEEWKNENGKTELLLSSLNSYSLPFVRYRVGDLAESAGFGTCSCGSPFPMIKKIQGRSRDMIKLVNGRILHGSVFNKIFFSFPSIRRYRVIQQKDYSIVIQVDVQDFTKWRSSHEKKEIDTKFTRLLPDTSFSIVKLSETNRGSGKFKLIESHVC